MIILKLLKINQLNDYQQFKICLKSCNFATK